MQTAVIFGAAEFDRLQWPIQSGDVVFAADGGLQHVQRLGITPDEIIGDFDSLGFVPEAGQVHPVEKDDTDTMLCIRRALARGCKRVIIYGGMDGPRLDHTIANFQSLAYLARQGCEGILVGNRMLAAVLKDGALSFPAGKTGDISVFCQGEDCQGVSIRGLFYEVENVPLQASFPLGVSNHFTGSPARIQVEQGMLLVLWSREQEECWPFL